MACAKPKPKGDPRRMKGRALDVAVAREVLGWELCDDFWYLGKEFVMWLNPRPPYFSSEWGSAKRVCDVLPCVSIYKQPHGKWRIDLDYKTFVFGDSLPQAICRAALIRVRSKPCTKSG